MKQYYLSLAVSLADTHDETAEELIGILRIKATKCKYKENDRRLKD